MEIQALGRILLVLGGMIALTGVVLILGGRLPFLGRLPGDVHFQREGVSCTVPLATSLLLSLIATILLNVVARLFRR